MGRRRRGLVPFLVIALGGLGRLAGQAPQDTVPVPRDTVDLTRELLEAVEDERIHLPTMPRPGRERLLPVESRIVLPRDSLDFRNAQTVGDLLSQVAGVYLWRGGWLGRPELPNYYGRGATSVEYLVDGVPYLPLGPDSLAIDPSILPLGFLERIEIETVPGLLRVHLFLRNHGQLAPWSQLTVARGQYQQARYEGILQKRARSGVGFTAGAAYWVSPQFDQNLGDFDAAYGWLEGSYVPSASTGMRVRYRLTRPDRRPGLTGDADPDTLSRPIKGSRSDLEARLTLGSTGEVTGRRTDLVVARSAWSSDSVNHDVWQMGLAITGRGATTSGGASLRYGTRWTRLDARAHAAWAITPSLSGALEGAYQRHDEGRSSLWLLGRAGARLPLGFAVSGAWRVGQIVARPAVPHDTAQTVEDRTVQLSWNTSRLGASVAYTSLASFQPVAFHQFAQIDSIAAHSATDWVTVSARIAPRQWFTISGWHRRPFVAQPEGVPPRHSMVTAAVRSQFLRTFPSGFFDLKLEVAVENWGAGVLGRRPDGTAVTLEGATFLRALIQMRFGDFIVYYDRANLLNTDQTYVPGFRIPLQAATYGVRWAFLN